MLKAELDLEFLVRCRDNNVIPRFLKFHLVNKSLRSILTYAQCQSNLLLQEIRQNKFNVRINVRVFRSSLQQRTNLINYTHICSKFLKSNDLKLKSNRVVQQKKFCNLSKEKSSALDPEKVIFDFSKNVLLDCEKSLLTKGLNFSIPCKKLDYADYLVNIELFFWDRRNLDILSNEGLDFVNAKTKEAAPSSYRIYNNVPQNLSKNEFIALQNLSKNKDFIIQKYDNGNSVVIRTRLIISKGIQRNLPK